MSEEPDDLELGDSIACPECKSTVFHAIECSRRSEPLPVDVKYDLRVGEDGRFLRVDWCAYSRRTIDIIDPLGHIVTIGMGPGDRIVLRQHGSGTPATPLRIQYAESARPPKRVKKQKGT